MTGTMRYYAFEGGFWAIRGDDEVTYDHRNGNPMPRRNVLAILIMAAASACATYRKPPDVGLTCERYQATMVNRYPHDVVIMAELTPSEHTRLGVLAPGARATYVLPRGSSLVRPEMPDTERPETVRRRALVLDVDYTCAE